MKRLMIPASMMFAVLAGPAPGDEVEFRPAYHLISRNEALTTAQGRAAIRFPEFMKIDWARLAQAHFTAYPLTGLSESQIGELAERAIFGSATITYVAPVTEEYRRARFIFLSADGIRPLNITGLSGTVRYELTDDLKRVMQVIHSGDVLGVPEPNNASGGGFVALLEDGQALLGETIAGPENPMLEAVDPFPGLGVLRQVEYRFSGADSSALFVQYRADNDCANACCQSIYFLFRKDPETGRLTDHSLSVDRPAGNPDR